jgi:hypothetical protein
VPSRLLASPLASAGIDLRVTLSRLSSASRALFIHQDLIFRDIVSAAQEEEDLDLADQDPANHEADANEVVCNGEDWSWDKLVEGEDEEELQRAVLTV